MHIQADHSFENEDTYLIPTFSIKEGATEDQYSPLEINGSTFKMSLASSPTQALITDLMPGTLVRFGLEYGGQSTGTLTISIST